MWRRCSNVAGAPLSPRPFHLAGGLRAARVFSFSAGMSAGSAVFPRKEGGARGPQRPGLGPGIAVEGTRLSAVAPRVWRAVRRASAEGGRLGAAPRPPLRVTSFVARGAGVGGLLPAGCTASIAELFFVSPGAGWKCGVCTFAPERRL